MSNILCAIVASFIAFQLLGVVITLVSYSYFDENEDYYFARLSFIPMITALETRLDLTIAGKLFIGFLDILMIPAHIFLIAICFIISGVYKLCIKETPERENY